MPPKRKNRSSLRKASTPVQDDESMVVDTPEVAETPDKENYDIPKDSWTDEQETSLFKGIIKWKPAGVHKHFRMIALSEYLRNHGYDSKLEPHTSIPGIWEKLGTLYNLELIDERENSFDWSEEDTVEEKYREFTLPDEQFADRMWEQGRAEGGTSSPEPEDLPARKRKRVEPVSKTRASTVDDTEDATSPPAPASGLRTGRRGIKGRQLSSKAKAEDSDRQTTVDETDEQGEEEETMVDDDQDDEDDGDDDASSLKASRNTAKTVKGGNQMRAQSKTRKSTRRK